MAGMRMKSKETLEAELAKIQKELAIVVAWESLPDHDCIEDVNKVVKKAANDAGTSEFAVRLAELKKFSGAELTDFCVEVNKLLVWFKEVNATYRNPEKPSEFWYAPKGKGNPPGWVRDKFGPKPKKVADRKKWFKQLESVRADQVMAKEAA